MLPKDHPLYRPPRTPAEQLSDQLEGTAHAVELALERLRGEGWSGPVLDDEVPFIIAIREQLAVFLPTVGREDLVAKLAPEARVETWEDAAKVADALLRQIAKVK